MHRHAIYLVSLVLGVAIVVATAAPITNLPHPFSTNVAGQYLMERPFVGESKATVQTGHFATHTDAPELQKVKRELRHDVGTSWKPRTYR